MNPLLDSEFLVKLNNDKNRTIYAHVISLNQYEHPIEQLEGVVTAGSITIDGQSAVRRICSLTLSAKNLNINNIYWGLTTKVKIEIGLQNNVDSRYDDIIWFPQGIFILTDFKTTQTINNYTINLSGKDKMCLLNGDVSGNLPAPVRFDSYTDATEQSYTLNNNETYYNNFIDNEADLHILEGFQERYGSDYQFIRGSKKILSLQYIPNGDINGMIKFSQIDEKHKISDLASFNEKTNIYNIDFGTKNIYGFIVENCNPGDRFDWVVEQKIPISIIIQEMLHQFGQEQYSNIIIKDIDPYGLEMLDSAYEQNLYLLHNGSFYEKIITKKDLQKNYLLYNDLNDEGTAIIDDKTIQSFVFRNYIDEDDISLIDIFNKSTQSSEKINTTQIIEKNNSEVKYTVACITNNQVAGYGMTLLVYPDELTGQIGDSITSILDKIVNMLGDYEYFYDLNGQFVFQAKPAYVKTAWNGRIFSIEDNYIDASELVNRVAYTFDDSTLTTQYQNNPNINNIKNDYIIWGERKNTYGNMEKIHGRYAIENVPLEYTDFNGYTWTSNKTQSLINALYKDKELLINNYQHTYNYPYNYSPEQYGWWEINDWINYYQTIFGVDLSISSIPMYKYHQDYNIDEKNQARNIFIQYFLNKNQSYSFTSSDVITIIYSDISKRYISEIYNHGGKCSSHYCAEFIDVRTLNQGWSYSNTSISEKYRKYKILNGWDTSKVYTLDNRESVPFGYHPDYTTSFIYRPILPTDLDIYSSDIISEIIYKDVYNMNGVKRKYALNEDVDWRHLINIMADDWYQHHTEDDYEINLRKNNNWPSLNINLFPHGRTGYEQYYLDLTTIGGWWQDLYNIQLVKYNYYLEHQELQELNIDEWNALQNKFNVIYYKEHNSTENDIQTISISSYSILYHTDTDIYSLIITLDSIIEKEKIEKELNILSNMIQNKVWTQEENNFVLSCDVGNEIFINNIINDNHISIIYDIIVNRQDLLTFENYEIDTGLLNSIIQVYNNKKDFFEDNPYKYWYKDVVINPENLRFWFDFFRADEMGIGKFAVSVIGNRPKTINDTAIKTIIYRDTPDVIYCSLAEYQFYKESFVLKDGYKYIILDKDGKGYLADTFDDSNVSEEDFPQNVKENFVRSIRAKTVHDQADTMLYQYSYYNDNVNINSVPIYYLSPNTIISTKDELSRVTGYYVINKINISLAYNGMMQITAIKSPERIY